ncbi:unnamed protein product, partial [Diamesa serratosioi]
MLIAKTFSRFRYFSTKIKSNAPLILGIETSCDDTGAAVLSGNKILGEAVHSQLDKHLMFGGIIPPVAQDFHRKNIEQVVASSLEKAEVNVQDLDAIAVTNRPGLTMSLLIGLRYAKHLARKHNKPIIPIHHMEAHALTARMNNDIKFPFLCLLVSGGHSLLAFVKDVRTFHLLGETLDDAPGEAFDKIARRLKMRNIPGFENKSGGQSIEEAARSAKFCKSYPFPLPLARYRDCQFSFAGMKNTAKRHIQRVERELDLDVDKVIPEYAEFCASFQAGVARHICNRTQRAMDYCEKEKLFENVQQRVLVVSGGVACNDFIFNCLSQMCDQLNFKAIRPTNKLCTDNGIMIAWNGIERYLADKDQELIYNFDKVEVHPRCQLGTSFIDKVKEQNLACKWVK